MGFTKEGIEQQEIIKARYSELSDYYNPYMGNFIFSPRNLKLRVDDIIKFIKEFPDYKIIIQGEWFYLTNFEE